ncbi:MAG: hypothetical protein OJF55_001858 [Rhodanobacteraceae bacterium]|nr:MAG: hypothetical protein OJF55_001858 [Rhodanobacteraceae bacterium]
MDSASRGAATARGRHFSASGPRIIACMHPYPQVMGMLQRNTRAGWCVSNRNRFRVRPYGSPRNDNIHGWVIPGPAAGRNPESVLMRVGTTSLSRSPRSPRTDGQPSTNHEREPLILVIARNMHCVTLVRSRFGTSP